MLDIKLFSFERLDHGATSDIGLPSKQPSAKDYLGNYIFDYPKNWIVITL